MRDGAGMAAGRTCLDCGGSPTRDFAFGCEHRFLEPEHVGRSPDPNGSDGALYLTALSLREAEDAIAAAARYDYDEAKRCGEACAAYASAAVAAGLEIGHQAAGHGVTAWAPTRETAVALWRARVLEVGRALVELVPWLRSVTKVAPAPVLPVVGVDPAVEPSSSAVTFVTPGPRGERHQVPADSAAGVLARLLDIELAQNREDACEALAVLGRAVGAGIELACLLVEGRDLRVWCRVCVQGSSRSCLTASRALLELAGDIDREIARRVDAAIDRAVLPPECRSCGSRLGDDDGLCDSCRPHVTTVRAAKPIERGQLVTSDRIEWTPSDASIDITYAPACYELRDLHPCQKCGSERAPSFFVTGPSSSRVLCADCKADR